jgi:small subunit ribosomal protein S29
MPPPVRLQSFISLQRSFSTTAISLAKKGAKIAPKPAGQKVTKRDRRIAAASNKGKPPAPGERKAQRKRILTESKNVLSVPGLPTFDLAVTTSSSKALTLSQDGLSGTAQVVELQDETVNRLKAIGGFQPQQSWRYLARPAVLLSKDAKEVLSQLQRAGKSRSTYREIIVGPRASGKSGLLLQAMSGAWNLGWTVIHIPDSKYPFLLFPGTRFILGLSD